jgi:hypothetical protein
MIAGKEQLEPACRSSLRLEEIVANEIGDSDRDLTFRFRGGMLKRGRIDLDGDQPSACRALAHRRLRY